MTNTETVETTADEDVFVLQPGWLRTRYARRGEPGLKARRPDAEKARAAIATFKSKMPGRVRKFAEHEQTDPEIGQAVLAYYQDQADPSPTGAAGTALAWHDLLGYNEGESLPLIADRWLAEQGLRFAVEAVVEMFSMVTGDNRSVYETVQPLRYADTADRNFEMSKRPLLDLAGRVRHALATAGEEEYGEVVEILARHRQTNMLRRVGTSFLAPTESAWVEADSVEVAATGSPELAHVLLTAIHTGEQAARITPLAESWWLMYHAPMLSTFMIGVRADALPALLSWLSTDVADYAKRFLPAIGAIPTDAAFDALLDRVDEKYVLPEVQAMANRFPARAMRLLAVRPTAKRTFTELLTAHVLAHQELAARLLPSCRSRWPTGFRTCSTGPPRCGRPRRTRCRRCSRARRGRAAARSASRR